MLDLTSTLQWPIVGIREEPKVAASADLGLGALVQRAAEALASWQLPDLGKVASTAPLWKSADSHPISLLLAVLDRYGNECIEWDPEVLKVTLIRDGEQISNTVWTKLMAVRVALNSPSPWQRWEVFHWVCRGLSGLHPNFTYLEMPALGHLFAGVDILTILDPSNTFQEEVEKFVATVFRHDGHVFCPEPLAFAQRELEDPQLQCTNCGAKHRDDHDVKCITCGKPTLVPLPYEFAALRDRCAALWKGTLGKPLEQAVVLPEDSAGNLVYNLVVERDYALQQRHHLLTQLRQIASSV